MARKRGGGGMAHLRAKYPDALPAPIMFPDRSALSVYDETCEVSGKRRRVWDQLFANGRRRVEKESLEAANEGEVVYRSDFTPRTEGEPEEKVHSGAAPAIVNSFVPKFAKPLLGRDFQSRQEFDKHIKDNKFYIPTFDEARNKLPSAPNAVHRKPAPKTSDEDGVTVTVQQEMSQHSLRG